MLELIRMLADAVTSQERVAVRHSHSHSHLHLHLHWCYCVKLDHTQLEKFVVDHASPRVVVGFSSSPPPFVSRMLLHQSLYRHLGVVKLTFGTSPNRYNLEVWVLLYPMVRKTVIDFDSAFLCPPALSS